MVISPRKRLGDMAELAFRYELLERNIDYAVPNDYQAPFDIITIVEDKLTKVQIKSAHTRTTISTAGIDAYFIGVRRQFSTGYCNYKCGDFDILAATVMPEHAWYLIPFNEIDCGSMTLYAGIPDKGWTGKRVHRWEKYLDRWDLLS